MEEGILGEGATEVKSSEVSSGIFVRGMLELIGRDVYAKDLE